MDPVKQIKAVAQTYLQEQQLKEQAEYISVLEHTIEVIAEELGIPPQQLINEISVMGRAAGAFKAAREGGSGVLGAGMAAVKAGAGAVGANMRQARTNTSALGSMPGLPTAGARMKSVAARASYKKEAGVADMAGNVKHASEVSAKQNMGLMSGGKAASEMKYAGQQYQKAERQATSGANALGRLDQIAGANKGVGNAFLKGLRQGRDAAADRA